MSGYLDDLTMSYYLRVIGFITQDTLHHRVKVEAFETIIEDTIPLLGDIIEENIWAYFLVVFLKRVEKGVNHIPDLIAVEVVVGEAVTGCGKVASFSFGGFVDIFFRCYMSIK